MTTNENIKYIKIDNEIYNLTNENNILNFGNHFYDPINKDNLSLYSGFMPENCSNKISVSIRETERFWKPVVHLGCNNDMELLKKIKIGLDSDKELELSEMIDILRIGKGGNGKLLCNLKYNNFELQIHEIIPKKGYEYYEFNMYFYPIIDYINLVKDITVTKRSSVWVDIESTYESLSDKCRGDRVVPLMIDECGKGVLCGTSINGKKIRSNNYINVDSKAVNWVEEDKCIINLDNLMKVCNTSRLLIEQEYYKPIGSMIHSNEVVQNTMNEVFIGNEKLKTIVNKLYTSSEFETLQMILNCMHYEIYVIMSSKGISLLIDRRIND